MRRLLPLAPLLLAACAGGDRGCEVTLMNRSRLPVEQVYLAPMGAAWGRDLLAGPDLPPGGALPLRTQRDGRYGIRAVWIDGRAVEMQGIEACRTARITLRDDALQAE